MKRTMIAVVLCILAMPAFAQRCKLEVETGSQIESKLLIIFRGGTVGLAGYFGISDGVPYLRGSYASQFRARAEFTTETPLVLKLANGETLELAVNIDARAKLTFVGAAFGNRQAQPVYAISDRQLATLAEIPITSLTLNFIVDGEQRSTDREVTSKHAEKIIEAIGCLQSA